MARFLAGISHLHYMQTDPKEEDHEMWLLLLRKTQTRLAAKRAPRSEDHAVHSGSIRFETQMKIVRFIEATAMPRSHS